MNWFTQCNCVYILYVVDRPGLNLIGDFSQTATDGVIKQSLYASYKGVRAEGQRRTRMGKEEDEEEREWQMREK